MDERELRTVMQEAISVAPPPMSDEPVMAAARQALKRRRAMAASAGSAAVVALVAVGVAVLAPAQGDDGGVRVGNQPPATSKTNAPTSTASTGATATSGPHYDRSAALAAALDDLAPAGFGTPDDLEGVDDFADRPLKTHTAMALGGNGGWYYAAGTPLTKGDGVGELIATVYSPEWGATGDGCALTQTAWDAAEAACTDVFVDGRKVAVADVASLEGDGLPPVQWAGYRHPDGTVVFVMQTAEVPRSGRPALASMPMPGQELAALATETRLKPE
jgi:hypothetical protein